jgi:hypothetical protein
MSAHDTLRWGDTQSIPVTAGEAPSSQTRQLLQLHWRWPLSWTVLLVMVPQFGPAENQTFLVTWQVTIGIGQAIQTFPLLYTFAPSGGVYAPQTPTLTIPAENLQMIATLTTVAGGAANDTDYMLVGAFGAPVTEPHAMTSLRDGLPHDGERVDWMPEGFHPERLRYGGEGRR